jgi:hypothetical protein
MQAEIVGMDSPVADPRGKQLLHAQTGAAAVDMESHIAARIAAAYQIPFVACRAIIDPADKPLPPAALVGLRPDGTADVLAVLRSVLQQPRQVPALVRTALDARIARAALRRGCRMLGAGLGFPDFQSTAPHQNIAATGPACACAGERGRTDRAPSMESATYPYWGERRRQTSSDRCDFDVGLAAAAVLQQRLVSRPSKWQRTPVAAGPARLTGFASHYIA